MGKSGCEAAFLNFTPPIASGNRLALRYIPGFDAQQLFDSLTPFLERHKA